MIISSLAWIPREVASTRPIKYTLTEEEYNRILKITSEKAEDARNQMQQELSQMEIGMDKDEQEIISKYNMGEYDGTKVGEENGDDSEEVLKEALLSKVDDLMDEETADVQTEVDEDSDVDDLTIRENDRIIVCGRTEDDVSYLDMYIYEESDDRNLYVHHDIMLPALPLCVHPVNHQLCSDNTAKNFVAVGSFEPDIEIWNMDVLDAACPTAILHGHKDAVMTLSWNTKIPNVLASGSADKSIIIWNLDNSSEPLVKQLRIHKDKVQSVQWSPNTPHLLASASYDKTIALTDMKSFESKVLLKKLSADPECLQWNPHDMNQLAFSDESGSVFFIDITEPGRQQSMIESHEKPCTVIQFHPIIPGLLLTASADRSFKLWDLMGPSAKCLVSREPGIGKIFTCSFAHDSPFIVACAGSHGELKCVNLDDVEPLINLVKERLLS